MDGEQQIVGERAPDRVVLRVTGEERVAFLQNLVTNNVEALKDGMVYSALLSPQGKFLADFFLVPQDDAILIDIAKALAPGIAQRLGMYKLRAAVDISATDMSVVRGLGTPPPGSFADPRHDALGWRAYGVAGSDPSIDWDAIRVEHVIPETGFELVPNETYILEVGFEAVGGVDFRKGCYVGQEVTARMKHKSTLNKGLVVVDVDGPAAPGAEITANGKPVGTLHTRSGGKALAYLRFNRAKGDLVAGRAKITWTGAPNGD
ncbi:MAG: folate-binding protein [Pseudomonadota bacterium]